MSYINFIISRMNYLPYYIPLVREGLKRNIKSKFFISNQKDKEYMSPDNLKNKMELNKLSKEYEIEIYEIDKIRKYPTITFFCEGDIVGIKDKLKPSPNFRYLTNSHIKVSIICNYEFVLFYDNYINYVDYVIFPNKFMALYYNKLSNKNLYLGSPKYDMQYYINSDDINIRHNYLINKYKLKNNEKYILIIYPKNPVKHHKKNTLYPSEPVLLEIYKTIRKLNYKIIVKTRIQDKIINNDLKGDYYIEDIDYTICNSMELIELSSIIIFFSSSINEECVALKKPYIDLKVDLNKNRFDYLNDINYGICWSYSSLVKFNIGDRIIKLITYLEKLHKIPEQSKLLFENIHSKLLDNNNYESSKKILDWTENKLNINNDILKALENN